MSEITTINRTKLQNRYRDARRTLEEIRTLYKAKRAIADVFFEVLDLTELFLVRSYSIGEILAAQLNKEENERRKEGKPPSRSEKRHAVGRDVLKLIKSNRSLKFSTALSASIRHGDWNRDHPPKDRVEESVVTVEVDDDEKTTLGVKYVFRTTNGEYDALDLATQCLIAWEAFCDQWGVELIKKETSL